MTEAWNGRPPAPLDERDGPHWVKTPTGRLIVLAWNGDEWERFGSENTASPYAISKGGYLYAAPVLTPDQIAAQIAEAVKAEREACAAVCERMADTIANNGMTESGEVALVLISEVEATIRARGETK